MNWENMWKNWLIFTIVNYFCKNTLTLYLILAIEEDQQKFVPADKIAEVKRFRESITTIKEMFSRDKMKVVFFGRYENL